MLIVAPVNLEARQTIKIFNQFIWSREQKDEGLVP